MKELDIFDPNLVGMTDLTVGLERQPLDEREAAVYNLVDAGLAEVERRYGPDGARPQAYHNADHSRDVMDAAIQLADAAIEAGKIEPSDKDLLILAACYHDIERDFASGDNEAASARIICQQMQDCGQFNNFEIAKVYKMIMATEVHFADGVMRQSAEPGDFLSQLFADADLSTLGKPPQTYWDRALRLIKEQTDKNSLDNNQCLAFALNQDGFLRHHNFYTEEAKMLFPYKQANIRFTQFMQRFYAGKHLRLLM
ncbi:MAG: HD domain-containing protein [Candidatus Saccharimonadales bacterium]